MSTQLPVPLGKPHDGQTGLSVEEPAWYTLYPESRQLYYSLLGMQHHVDASSDQSPDGHPNSESTERSMAQWFLRGKVMLRPPWGAHSHPRAQ